jgi:hypothetical protein
MSPFKNKGWDWLPRMGQLSPDIGATGKHAFVPTHAAAPSPHTKDNHN